MTAPTEHDVSPLDPPALETWQAAQEGDERPWSELFDHEIFGEDAGARDAAGHRLPAERASTSSAGPVEDTLPAARARASSPCCGWTPTGTSRRATSCEHLYPRLAAGGVLIIDDYGHWDGARRAVDEYFARQAAPLLLNRIDYTGRIAVKH